MRLNFSNALLALAVGVVALPHERCCFELTATGDTPGLLTQLSGGQNRIGTTGLSAASYCIWNGMITDAFGRVCILTESFEHPTQFICSGDPRHEKDFSISKDGLLEYGYNKVSTFYACPASPSEYNIFAHPLTGFSFKCSAVTLSTNGKCAAYS